MRKEEVRLSVVRPLASLSRVCQTVGTAPSSISMLPARGRVVVLPHPCNTGPTGMRDTGAVDRRLLVACHPEVLRSGATRLMSAALFAARRPPPAASGKPPCGHPHPGEDGSEPQPTTTGRCYLGVIITGTIYVHTHGSQQRSAARFDKFHLVRAGGCLEPGRVGEAVVHPPSSILRPPSRAYESARCNTCRIREGTV